MALQLKDYGNGSLGDVTSVTTTINSYARVTAVSANTVTINADTQIEGDAKFEVGAKVLLHVSASSGQKTYLGKYLLANVTGVNNNVLTLDENATTKLLPAANVGQYYIQAIAVAQYQNLKLSTGTTITPPVYSATSYHGGIVAIMCSEKLTFEGGHIALTDRGIPVASKNLRPILNQESQGTLDTGNYSGWENDCSRFFPLNAGDGAAFIVAKEMACHTNSRIGNVSSYGVQFYRGSNVSVTYNESAPSNVTNVGGASIFIAAQTITGFTPRMISKYRSSSATAGQGICRCYIASETKLRNDEGLYAYDIISKPARIKNMNIKNYGNGSFGDMNNITAQLNNYATITAINGNKVTYKNQTTAGLAQIAAGALVMIHFNHKSTSYTEHSGRFILAKVLADNGSILTLDTVPPDISVTQYAAQIVSIPQANDFTLSTANSSTPAFNGAQGGIFAIAVKGTCNLGNGNINVADKGGGSAYGRNGLAHIGNAQDCDKLPIGQGHGSVFILAQGLTMNTSTRIGGYGYAGNAVYPYRQANNQYAGSGANGGTGALAGGYGGNGGRHTNYANNAYTKQGAHIMIVADKITGFNQNAIGTGGGVSCGAGYGSRSYNYSYYGYNGGAATSSASYYAGGSSGWAFIYCNQAVNQNTSSTIYDG